jgi:hypothetical protein
MARLRVATWNIAGARRERSNAVDLEAMLVTARSLGVDLLALQEVDRLLARSGRADQPQRIAQTLGAGWSWSYAPALSATTSAPCRDPTRAGRPTATCCCPGSRWRTSSTCASRRRVAASSAPPCWPPSGSARGR